MPLPRTQFVLAPNLAARWAVAYGANGEIIVLARDAEARREIAEIAGGLIAVDDLAEGCRAAS